ncbi:type VII secretion system-associated protein [Amycolatopsis sp. cg5]|uniref:type VII secretion system-associated protein n=1 Tax=Amycolatopsis sp. cg5 TaxID=3238802 RepID=UPI00352485C4
MTSSSELLLLVDPAWRPTDLEPDPPAETAIGAWLIHADGTRSRFQPNPVYRPSTPDSPFDPVDAELRRLATGAPMTQALYETLRDVDLSLATDLAGTPLVRPAPDGIPSLLVTTSPPLRTYADAPAWLDVTLTDLATALPSSGLDVLLNPGSPASLRLTTPALHKAAHPPPPPR